MDNKSKWNVIRRIGIGGNCPKTDFDVHVNKSNDQFVHFRVPKSIGIIDLMTFVVSLHNTPLVFVA